MKKKGTISVIVPVYNVEKYLAECIESIINQTYEQLEIILIDDESSDCSGSICDKYAQTDDRIIVIHQKNGGAASARNAGLRIASGEYITFVDSDDYLELDAYDKMLLALETYNADVVHGNFRYVYVDKSAIYEAYRDLCSFSTPEFLLHFTKEWTCGLSVVKLFRHNVLSNVFYEEGHLIDDEFFTYKGIMNAEKIVCIPDIVYNYRQRASSVMKNQNTAERRWFDRLDYIKKRCEDVVVRFPEIKNQYETNYVESLLWFSGTSDATTRLIKEIKKRLLRFAVHNKKFFLNKERMKLAVRVFYFIVQPIGKYLKKIDRKTVNSNDKLFQ